jgi:type 1 glutamine amidotransferase
LGEIRKMNKRWRHRTLLAIVVLGSAFAVSDLGAETPKPSRAEVEAVLAQAPKPPAEADLRTLNVLLLADVKDHGPGEHDYPLWQKQWQTLLTSNSDRVPNVKVETATRWPNEEQLAKADLLVMFCYPGAPKVRIFSRSQIEQLEALLARGGGFVPVHSATYTLCNLSEPDGKKLLSLVGLEFPKSIQYRHGPIELHIADPKHPICLGVPKTLHFVDEPYWPPTGDLGKVQVLATSDESVAPGSKEKAPQPMFWTHTFGKGRVYGCVMGHYSATFDDPYFRILLLRGMAWAAGESPYRFDPLVLAK